MISSKTMFSVAALACAWIGLAGCDGAWPIDAKAALEAAKNGTSAPTKPEGEKPGEKPAGDPGKPGGSSDGTAPVIKCSSTTDPKTGQVCKTCYGPDGKTTNYDCTPVPQPVDPGTVPAAQCKDAYDATGKLCQTCFDATGKLIHDGCKPGGSSDGTEPVIKCSSTTDPKTGQVCKTCSGPDGKVTTYDCTPVAQPGSIVSCTPAIDEKTGQACKVCTDETGKVTYTDCATP